jgi:hypothetical protein
MMNGLLGYPLLDSLDYRPTIIEEANANEAEIRAVQYIRHYCDGSYEVDPPFEYWETDRPSREGKRLGPKTPDCHHGAAAVLRRSLIRDPCSWRAYDPSQRRNLFTGDGRGGR